MNKANNARPEEQIKAQSLRPLYLRPKPHVIFLIEITRMQVKILVSIPTCGWFPTPQRNSSTPADVLQLNSNLSLSTRDSVRFYRSRAQSHKTVLCFRCQSQELIVACAFDQRAINWTCFARVAHRTQENSLLSRSLVYYKGCNSEQPDGDT